MTTSYEPTAASLPQDEQGRLGKDCPCVRCGYNLRGLLPESVCPECATPVARSVRGDLLMFSDPTWVGRLASGMNWIAAGILLALLTGMFSFAGFTVVGSQVGRFGGLSIPERFVAIGIHFVLLIGFWKVTTPDPSKGSHETELTARRIVRFWAVAGLILIPLRDPFQRISVEAMIFIQVVSAAIGMLGLVAVCAHGAYLAERIPEIRLARETRNVMWGLIICTGLLLVVAAVTTRVMGLTVSTWPSALAFAQSDSTFFRILTGGVWAVGIGAYLSGIWGFVLLFQYRKALKDSAKLARETWAGTRDRVGTARNAGASG